MPKQWYTSRLGPGSGSTPSVTRCQGRDMVVLTDGELGMALVYLDAETGGWGCGRGWDRPSDLYHRASSSHTCLRTHTSGEELGRAAVDFGPNVDASRVTSEQSVAVRECVAWLVCCCCSPMLLLIQTKWTAR